MILDAKDQHFIIKVTHALNRLGDPPPGYLLSVALVDADTHELCAIWNDDLGSDDWIIDTEPGK